MVAMGVDTAGEEDLAVAGADLEELEVESALALV